MKAPREQKTAPNLNFHIVFLSCVKAIEEPQHRLGKIPVASCLDPWVLRKGRLPAFLQRYFVCIEGKPTFLQSSVALGEQPGTQRESKQQHFIRAA